MSVTRSCDAVLDAVIVVLASWTVVYHVSLVAGLSASAAVLAGLVLLGPAAALWWWPRPRPPASPPAADAPNPTRSRLDLSLTRVTVALAVLSAAAMAVSAPWPLVWVSFLLAAGTGTARAVRAWVAVRPGAAAEAGPPPRGRWDHDGGATAGVVLVWALGLATLSSVIQRPNPDDLFYLNLAQWVADTGTFALRDTLFSDLVYPIANWPPTASYDPLIGAVAHLVGVRAAGVAYVAVPPVATVLAVLALWRLLRAWRVRHVAVVLSVALVFLLLDGTSSYASPGNLFLTRLWQGKVVLLCVVVPLLLVHALAYVDRPSRRGAARLALTGAAAVSLSTTALFLTPLLALAGTLPLVLTRRWWAATLGFGAAAAYPLAGAAATVVLGGRSADDFGSRKLFRFDPEWFGHQIFLTGMVALVGVAAVLVGSLLVPHPAARVTTGLLVLATAVTFVPGVTWLSYDLVGLGPTLWRISWGCTVAALVGVLVVHLADRVRGWLVPRSGRRVPVAALVALVVGLGAVGGFGSPIWSPATASSFVEPLQWKRGQETQAIASWLLRSTRSDELVLAPRAIAISLAVTTTELKSVAPRVYYMSYLRDDPGFRYPARRRLMNLVEEQAALSPRAVRRDLETLGVGTVCLERTDRYAFRLLLAQGWDQRLLSTTYRCLRRE